MKPLVRYDAACRAIAAAKVVDEVKGFHDKAAAMQAYARQARNRHLEIDAAEIRMRAERRLGELLQAAKGKGQVSRGQPSKKKSAESEQYPRMKLAKAGIDRKLSSRSQKLAAMPVKRFEGLISDWRHRVHKEGERVTANLLRRDDIRSERKPYESRKRTGHVAALRELVGSGRTFPVIYADPPWQFTAYNGKDKPRAAERRYNTMSFEELSRLPVASLAASECALFMWCPSALLPDGMKVVETWGFEYKTIAFVWLKQNPKGEGLFTGMGYWTRSNAELCLLATRGKPKRHAMDVRQVIMSPVRDHSRKPNEAAARIERLLAGPYLELFARGARDGWTTWGDEIAGDEFQEAAE